MLHGINEITVLQSFRCHIQEVQLSFASFVQYLIDILFRAGHINIIGRNVMLLQRLHLIVDQSKQWFDDDSQLVGMSQTNRFVDNLFARTRGSNDDCVLSSIKCIHRNNLCLTRLVKAKLFECRFQVSFHIHRDNLQRNKIIFMLSECKKIMPNSEYFSKINCIFQFNRFSSQMP